jgi:hypothetical protein
MPLAKHSVFDRHILAKMRNLCTEPRRFRLETDVPLMEASDVTPIQLIEDDSGLLRLWEEPTPGAQYIIGVDTAAGLAGGDASCATVLKVWADSGLVKFKMVAQFHGWEDQFRYADDCFKLAIHYNSALVVVELTGGLGRAVVLRLKELAYWNIFRDIRQAEFADPGREPRFGVDTSAYSKPFMVSCLQHAVKEGLIEVPCRATIEEMAAFSQEKSDSGKTTLYRGAQGSHDDRVMSVVIAVSVAMSSPTFQIAALLADQHETQPKPAPSSDF